MDWGKWLVWLAGTILLGSVGLIFAFVSVQSTFIGLLLYLPLTAGLVWLMVFRGRIGAKMIFFILWVLVYLGWLTYLGPLVSRMYFPDGY